MCRKLLSLWMLFMVCALSAAEKAPVKVACIGNSITFGSGIKNRFQDSYPGILSQWLGDGYDVRNFGLSGRVLLNRGDRPYMHEPTFKEMLAFRPDIVTIKLGTNDSKPHNWRYAPDFRHDLEEMLDTLAALPSSPKVYLCLPVPAVSGKFGIRDSVIVNGVIPVVRRVAAKRGLTVIDLHEAMTPYAEYYTDGIHPDERGAAVIASTIYKTLTGKEAPEYTLGQPFPGNKSQWKGHDRYDFVVNGRHATVVTPAKSAEGRPWIWRPAFFGAFASVDSALLEKGFHVAYYDLTHLYGSPRAVKLGTEFYDVMCRQYGLSPKVTLEGFSRGGLFAFNWAARNPGKVACIYVDAPVCDLNSWPGRSNTQLWSDMLAEWGISDEDMDRFKGNPIDNLAPIAEARIPVIAVCGDSDRTVPYADNMARVAERYRALGAPVEIILKPGVDHHPHSLTDPEPVVDFIVRNQPDYQARNVIHRRGSLDNSYVRFARDKEGCVAFLGGSITEMRGWRDMIKEDLQQRFPDTKFTFIEAGLPSAGSTPHAFRMENDVLSGGVMPDLMFVEAAVNDHTNGFDYTCQTRGMEGIVRHALAANPEMDLVMLHFIYDPFIPVLDKGLQPDVIMTHESVANYYSIPSINLAEEVAGRMRDGQFDWKQFGGTHPAWEGHKYYAAAINRLFDLEWSGDKTAVHRTHHDMPSQPIDTLSYFHGHFEPIAAARSLKDWKIVDDWTPTNGARTRKGFVNVPMLVAEKPGASLKFDFSGRAVGIFCAAGPDAGVLEYSIDGAPYRSLDTYTQWSKNLYLPWAYILAPDLSDGPHTLTLRLSKATPAITTTKEGKNIPRTACYIRNFLVN